MKQIVSLSLEKDLVCLVDRERGITGRSAFVEDILRKELVK